MCLKKYLSSLIVLFCAVYAIAQPLKFVDASLHYGTVFAHSQDVQNTKGANPVGLELGYIKTDTSQKTYNACKCNTQKGFNLVYFNYDNRILGHAVALNYVFEPKFYLSNNISVGIKGQFGLAYQSNPYHVVNNPTNMTYSLPVSFYGGLSLGSRISINKKFAVGIFANYLHTSNGGIKDPNKGVNWPTASLALQYYLTPAGTLNYSSQQVAILKKVFYTVYAFYSSRTTAIGQKARYSIFGFNANAIKPLSAISGIIAGVELYNDLSVAKRLQLDNINNTASIRSGFMAGHVFLLGKFNFSQQLGFYLYSPSPYFTDIYHRWMLNYSKNNRFVIGVSLKAHAQVANFIDARIGYRFK